MFLDDHLDRLFEGCKAIDININLSKDEIKDAIIETQKQNNMNTSAHARLMITRGNKVKPFQQPSLSEGINFVIIMEHSEVDSITKLWEDYKISGVTNLVKDIKTLIENIDSSVKLSVAVKPNIIEAKYRWYQDWLSWINLDLIDFAVVMNYEKNINKFNFNNRIINNSLTTFGKQKVVIGISTFNQNAIDVADKIILSRLSGFNNFSLYNYNQQQIVSDWYNPVINVFNFNIE